MRLFVVIGMVLLLVACSEGKKEIPVPANDVEFTKEESIAINQFWVRDESFKIDQYVARHGWDVTTTESGIRYFVYSKGEGIKVEKGMVATLDFEIKLLNSDTSIVYTSGNQPESFLVEMDDVESGLHEALKYLHVGDKAIVILPHYAAHGLLGDMNKIPPLSAVIYDINVLHAEKPQ